jgi:cytoskeleton protein RodZ
VDPVAETSDTAIPKTVGQTLAAERERQGLSRPDVAQRLHMSAYQIEALENADYARLPKGTFLRGFVRNYAKLLGLPPDSVLPLLTEVVPAGDKKPGIVVPTQNIRFDPLGERLQSPYVKAATIAVVVVSLAFAAMYWWLFIRHGPPGSGPARKAPEAAAPAPTSAAPSAVAPAPKPEVVASIAVAPPPVPAKAEPPKKTEAVKAAADGSTLKFRFKGQSWVEIRDGKGRLLISRLNPAGSEAEVSGRPPFSVVVGNAPEVEMFYNDHEFDLEPHTKVAVARFTVE